MDEPTSALTPAECARLFRIVRQLAADGVGRRLHLAPARRGHGAGRPGHGAARRAQRGDRADRRDGPRPHDRGDGRAADRGGRRGRRARAGGAPVLEVRGLSLDVPARRGWQRVLDGVDFDVRRRRGARDRRACSARAAPRSSRRCSAQATGARGGEIRIEGAPVAVALAAGRAAARASRWSPRTARPRGCISRHRSATTSRCRRWRDWRASASAPRAARRGWRAMRSGGSGCAAPASSRWRRRSRAATSRRW